MHAAPDVSLEQDLARRDFTINAIAQDANGMLIDPFGGARDVEARVLRHVGEAFVEDPVRVLRAARFMARFADLGFRVAEETRALMQRMVDEGEVDHLVPERVWQELQRALRSTRPSAFLQTLRDCAALARILPEVDALYGVPQRVEFHPEVDAGIHTGMVCDMAARLAPGDDLIGFAALTHDLGKGPDPARATAAPPAARTRGPAPARRAVRTPETAGRAPGAGRTMLPRTPQRASLRRAARRHRARTDRARRRLPQARAHRPSSASSARRTSAAAWA
jgi:tRNA nucleotidyltransferase (CCA-adding enzyme)